MSQDHLKNVAASVRQRLLNRTREQDEEYQLLLERYVQERFLHRLEQSPYEGEFVLKGATLFIVWQGERHRAGARPGPARRWQADGGRAAGMHQRDLPG